MHPKTPVGKKSIRKRPSLKVVGAPKNEFGTRLCQRIQCQECKKVDHVSVRVAKAKSKFCRECAEKYLNSIDMGRFIGKTMVGRVCMQCKESFKVNEEIAQKKEELMCLDCYRGFDVWRGKVSGPKASPGRA